MVLGIDARAGMADAMDAMDEYGWMDGWVEMPSLIHLEAVRHCAPAAVLVSPVFFGFAAVAAAVDDQGFGVDGRHLEYRGILGLRSGLTRGGMGGWAMRVEAGVAEGVERCGG